MSDHQDYCLYINTWIRFECGSEKKCRVNSMNKKRYLEKPKQGRIVVPLTPSFPRVSGPDAETL